MLDKALATVIATAAACAAAVMAVFAGGFAIYSLVLPSAGPAGAAGIVALIASLAVGGFAVFVMLRSRRRERDAAIAQAQVVDELPLGLGEIARERPIVTLAITALGGILATRHPTLARDLIAIVARFGGRR
jgi:hypothetical protein